MALIEWDDEIYSVGIKAMDEEHKVLIGLINALHARKDSADADFIESVLETLIQYTQNHFAHEERILRRMNYQALDHHREAHFNFEKEIKSAVAQYKEHRDNEETLTKLIIFLKNWLQHHILVEDKDYGDYLSS